MLRTVHAHTSQGVIIIIIIIIIKKVIIIITMGGITNRKSCNKNKHI